MRQVVATVKDHNGNVDEAATYLGVSVGTVRAAISYYGDFSSEITADTERANQIESDERARWEREQAAFA